EEYAPLVRRIAHRMKRDLPACVECDDLVQVGMMGLMQALDRYEEMPGAKFETYAGRRITGAMLDELRRMDWVPRLARKRGEVITTLVSVEGLSPADGDFLELMCVDEVTPLDRLIEKEKVFAAVAAIEKLPERERRVIDMHYDEDSTFPVIGVEFGVSESRVCQIHKGAIARAREIFVTQNG
ncbi:MAG TPA: sigma-70 family RNA polymerase sigma factor, partial [Anaerolineaceae bacterium]|nr:sigma-70 family RNA polymerase sigma factor [Anaerolineaceae bacterium]